jgi:hypothetical protein
VGETLWPEGARRAQRNSWDIKEVNANEGDQSAEKIKDTGAAGWKKGSMEAAVMKAEGKILVTGTGQVAEWRGKKLGATGTKARGDEGWGGRGSFKRLLRYLDARYY